MHMQCAEPRAAVIRLSAATWCYQWPSVLALICISIGLERNERSATTVGRISAEYSEALQPRRNPTAMQQMDEGAAFFTVLLCNAAA